MIRRRPRPNAVAALALVLVVVAGACTSKAGHDPIKRPRTTTSTTAVARPDGYVALGDSSTAGGGAPPYDVNPGCAVSSKGYPYTLVAADPHLHLVEVRACGGASTTDLLQASSVRHVPAQIPSTPDLTIGLVTLTIGGIDTGLPELVAACATLDCSSLATVGVPNAKLTALTDTLADQVYPALRKAYPKARLIQVGYPHLTSTKLNETCPWLASDEEIVPNLLVDAVNGAAAAAARRSGQVEYLDVSNVFQGHDLCTPDPWANDITAGAEALHANAAGYVALGRAIASALER